MLTERGIPSAGIFVISEKGTLTVKPNVVHIIGKHFQRLGLPEFSCGNLIGAPDGLLLVHHVAAYKTSVVINDDGTVLTLTDGAYQTLRHAMCVVSVTELIGCLLLHVEADHALVGAGAPEVLVAVDIHDAWNGLDTHPGKILLHVALETLCLWMIDAITGSRLNQQVTVQRLLNGVDVAVGQ